MKYTLNLRLLPSARRKFFAGRKETYSYAYDHAGHPTVTKYKINSDDEIILSCLSYDDFGRVSSKKLHTNLQAAVYQETVNYGYNIRNWLKSIATSHSFIENLYYTESYSGNTPCYNGNISALSWRQIFYGNTRGYRFFYDGLNRLSRGEYLKNGAYSTNFRFDEKAGYDKMGNITSLERYGNVVQSDTQSTQQIDNLSLSYSGNQLKNVTESVTSYSQGFINPPGTAPDNPYVYNKNGALTQDYYRGISLITYNALNLPQRIQFRYGHNTQYGYDASGMKRWVIHETSKNDLAVQMGYTKTLTRASLLSRLTTDYCANGHIIYENGSLKWILNPEGFLKKTNKFVYHYYLKDHLGNNRSVIAWDGTGYTYNQINVMQETNHYPFGMPYQSPFYGDSYQSEYQPYKFGGKELDAMYGLNWYDQGARPFDGIIPRTPTMDPLAEKYYSISPYAFCGNNPVNRIDPTGMYFDEANEKKAYQLEQQLDKRITKIETQVTKLEKAGKDIGDRRDRISELQSSKSDIADMRNNETVEFRYEKASDKNNPAGQGNPTIDGLGTNTVTMYVEGNMGSQLHESRHGGDVSRGTLTLENYNVNHEVSAYQAQYSWDGNLRYFNSADPIAQSTWQAGLIPMSTSVTHFNQITPEFVNRIGVLNTVNYKGNIIRGIGKLYPPSGININRWNNH